MDICIYWAWKLIEIDIDELASQQSVKDLHERRRQEAAQPPG